MEKEQADKVIAAVYVASEKWKTAFNAGDASGCAAQYEENAVMHARPFGTCTGIGEIRQFWRRLIDEGFSDIIYLESNLEVIDESRAILTAKWKMNKAEGVIHKELWVLQDDGSAKLREDDFEAAN